MNLVHLCGRFMDLVWKPSPLVSISIERTVYASAELLTWSCALIRTAYKDTTSSRN